ncbi:uncharacterized protein LOC133339987 [Lethenteron reissneri]|uniref:uncharacterized protein LOC133339987 n=1 Tax=Lethenteron reissneri TaxID=7753 RepID=UPI002AB6DE69|nr:uncharacterized protein LOC133339987 [Lethenteron reissneri]
MDCTEAGGCVEKSIPKVDEPNLESLEEKLFPCSDCSYGATQKSKLKRHILSVHHLPFDSALDSNYPKKRRRLVGQHAMESLLRAELGTDSARPLGASAWGGCISAGQSYETGRGHVFTKSNAKSRMQFLKDVGIRNMFVLPAMNEFVRTHREVTLFIEHAWAHPPPADSDVTNGSEEEESGSVESEAKSDSESEYEETSDSSGDEEDCQKFALAPSTYEVEGNIDEAEEKKDEVVEEVASGIVADADGAAVSEGEGTAETTNADGDVGEGEEANGGGSVQSHRGGHPGCLSLQAECRRREFGIGIKLSKDAAQLMEVQQSICPRSSPAKTRTSSWSLCRRDALPALLQIRAPTHTYTHQQQRTSFATKWR